MRRRNRLPGSYISVHAKGMVSSRKTATVQLARCISSLPNARTCVMKLTLHLIFPSEASLLSTNYFLGLPLAVRRLRLSLSPVRRCWRCLALTRSRSLSAFLISAILRSCSAICLRRISSFTTICNSAQANTRYTRGIWNLLRPLQVTVSENFPVSTI